MITGHWTRGRQGSRVTNDRQSLPDIFFPGSAAWSGGILAPSRLSTIASRLSRPNPLPWGIAGNPARPVTCPLSRRGPCHLPQPKNRPRAFFDPHCHPYVTRRLQRHQNSEERGDDVDFQHLRPRKIEDPWRRDKMPGLWRYGGEDEAGSPLVQSLWASAMVEKSTVVLSTIISAPGPAYAGTKL